MGTSFTINRLAELFTEKITEVQEEPEFQRSPDKTKYATDTSGQPLVKLGLANVPLDYDLWEGLRNPALVGLYPAGLPELWEFYANRTKEKVDETGRPTIFKIPRSFDFARRNYRRVVIASVMLPFSHQITGDYTDQVSKKKKGSSHPLARMYEDVNKMLDMATTRAAIELVADDNVVLVMNNNNVANISTESIPLTHQGDSHGPRKGGNFPQKSIAVLTGLAQFGTGRFVFRDELIDNKVQRFAGPVRSIILFDTQELVTDGSDGIIYPSAAWRNFLFKLSDFTNTDPEVNQYRFCSYIPQNSKGCGRCIENCPSGAQPSSVPAPTGIYAEDVARQKHRFWEGQLQFDHGKCCDERGQMAGLFPEWSCARCVSVCVNQGVRRKHAAKDFYQKMAELATEPTVAR